MTTMAEKSPPGPAQLDKLLWRFVREGKTKQALTVCSDLNRLHPDYASGWHSASQLAQRLNNPPMALRAIEKAVALEPDNNEWLLQQAYCLMQLGDTRSARPVVEHLAGEKLANAYQYATLALLLSRLELQQAAMEKYQSAIALEPGRGSHHYNLATVQRFLGQLDEADASLARALELDPADHEAHKLRADLRRQTPESNHVDTLESLLKKGVENPRARADICFALAKELEDLERYPRSFDCLAQGAELRRSLMRYQPSGDLQTMTQIVSVLDAKWLSGAGEGYTTEEPIFVLGMPRTGTTLVERILGSHSQVTSAGELNNFALQLTQLARESGPRKGESAKQQLVERSARLDYAQLGAAYLESTRPLSGQAPRFIDKMPLNFLYIGLIHAALPQAKIVQLQRDPLDTCFAIFKTSFRDAYPFSYKLEELGHYYLAYEKLMAHWHRLLPGVVHTVRYEELVTEPEGIARNLLAYCDLQWEEQCLQFHSSSAASTTASASQVRQPIYRSSVGNWRNYSEQLQPLIEILADGGVQCLPDG
jgi:tetratricopeptide (TPR) repeat protein